MIKTISVKKSDIKRERHILDASDQTLGRFATQVATLLMGKHKTTFSRNADMGDFVTVTNADKVAFTGKKGKLKIYYHHTMYPRGLREESLERMMKEHPTRVIEHAVKGMLPQNHLKAKMMRRLKVFAGAVPSSTPQPKAEAAAK